MPGYVHTCEQCGNEMLVPERYLGRELRCTSCPARFIATAPAQATILEVEVPPAPKRRWPAVAVGCSGLFVVVVALVVWLGSPGSGSTVKGREAVLGDGSRPAYYATFDRATMVDLARLLASPAIDREQRLRQLLDSYRVIEVPSGTRLEVLVSGAPREPVQVRLLSGRWSEKKVWVMADWLR